MTEPTTEAGRRLLAEWPTAVLMRERVIAIEDEARAEGIHMAYGPARADALREAAERVRALNPEPARGRVYRHAENHMKRRVLAILDPEAAP